MLILPIGLRASNDGCRDKGVSFPRCFDSFPLSTPRCWATLCLSKRWLGRGKEWNPSRAELGVRIEDMPSTEELR